MPTVRRPHSLPSRLLASLLSGLTLTALTPAAFAGPSGEQVVHGSASFSRDGSTTTIVAGDRAIIQYGSFDILANETVQFVQPGASARVLNRVMGADPTQIDGALQANGRVYIVNPYGIYFGGQAVVDAGAVFAAAGALSNEDFLARQDRFTNLDGRVVNLGSIRADVVALLGSSVANLGNLQSQHGLIALVAGSEVVLVPIGERVRVRVRVAPGAAAQPVSALPGVENSGSLDAGEGEVQLAAGDLYSLAVRQSGTGSIRARDVSIEGTSSGQVEISGRIDASSASGQGGSVAILGEHVALRGASVDASGAAGGGRVLLGGDYQGGNGVRTSTSTLLDQSSSVRADATVAGAGGTVVAWSDGATRVHGDISVRGAAGGSGGFVETSGHYLEVARTPDVGAGGSWLIDPFDVEIVAGGASTNNTQAGSQFDPTDTPSTIGVDLITGALTGGANVIVTTTAPAGNPAGPGAEPGNITLNADLDYNTGTGSNQLTLQANNDIVLNNKIFDSATGDGDALSVHLEATGDVIQNAAATIETNGGDLVSSGVGFTSNATIDAAGGQVSVSHSGGVAVNADISGADIDLSTTGDLDVATPVVITGTSSVALQAGTDGTGDLTFLTNAPNVSEIRSPTVTLAAGDGLATAGTSQVAGLANVVLAGAAGGATSPSTITLEQDGDLATTGLAFGAGAPTTTTLSSHEGSLTVDSNYDYDGAGTASLTLNANETLTFAADITDSDTTSVDELTLVANGGQNGADDITFNAGSDLHAESVTLAAGDGTGTSEVNFANAAIRGTGGVGAPASFALVQDAAIADAVDPNAVFGGATAIPGVYRLESRNGDTTIATAARVDGSDLTVVGQDVVLAAGLDVQALDADATAAGGTITLNGDVTSAGGQHYRDAVLLAAVATQLTAGDDVDFDSTVNGASALTVSAADATIFGGAVGGTTALTSVTTDGGGSTAIDGGSVRTSGAQDYQEAVTLGAAATQITALNAGATVDFDQTVNGASALTVTASGVTTFGGAVGGGTNLTSVTTNGTGATAINGGSVITTGAQDYQDTVTFGAAATQISGSSVTFAQTVNGASALTVTAAGATTFGGAVGGGTSLTSVTTNGTGNTAINGGSVVTTGAQDYQDTVTLGAAATQISGSSVNFAQTVNGASALTVTAAGATTFGGAVGGGTNLTSVTTNGGGNTAINGASVLTTGAQDYQDTVTLGGPTTQLTASAVDFDQTVNGASALTVTAAGATNFGGAVGATTALTSVTANGGGNTAINGASVVTTGAQDYTDTVTLGAATTQISGSAVSFAQTVNGASALMVTAAGATTFGGTVGAGTNLTSVTTNGGGNTAINGGSVLTTGAQDYQDTVTLGAAATQITGASANFAQTVNGASALTVTAAGATTFGGAVGGGTNLTSVTTNGGGNTAINGGSVLTTGAQDYQDTVTLGGATTQLTASAVDFDQTVNGASALTVTAAGATNFAGAVGGTTALASVTTNGGGNTAINGGSVITTGAQDYQDTATLGAATTQITGGSANFAQTVNGASALTVTASGATTFVGSVGAGTNLTSVTTNGGGSTAINGGTVLTTGTQDYQDSVTLGGPTTQITASAVDFDQTVNGASALTVTAAGATNFGGAVGGTTALTSVTANGGGNTAINGGSVITTGAHAYTDTVTLGAATTQITSGSTVSFAGTVNGASALTVTAPGATTFGAAVGGTTNLTSLATGGGGASVFNVAGSTPASPTVRTTGDQTYSDMLLLQQNTVLDATTNGTITLGADVAGSGAVRDLTVGAEQIRIGGNLGVDTDLVNPPAAPTLGAITLDVKDDTANHNDFIEFTGAGAQSVSGTGAIAINADGRAATGPIQATVFKRSGDLAINGNSVAFGHRDKVTVVGNLAITGATTVAVPDLTALDITINAGSLDLLTRESAQTSLPGGGGTRADSGMDIAANRVELNLGSTTIGLVPAPGSSVPTAVKVGTVNASNADVNGAPLSNPLAAVAIFLDDSNQAITAADLIGPVGGVPDPNTVLDLQAEGAGRGSTRPPPSPVFMLIAKPSGGVNAAASSEKPLRSSEVTAFLRCDPEDAECQEKAVGAARARSKEAQELRQSYAKLFGASEQPAGKSAAEVSKETLQKAVDAYRANTSAEPTGVAFRQFCESSPDHAQAAEVLNGLRNNLRLARAFGRSGEGLGDYKQQVLGSVLPNGLTLEALEAAVESSAVGPQP